jgi:predicted Zn-dependent protease
LVVYITLVQSAPNCRLSHSSDADPSPPSVGYDSAMQAERPGSIRLGSIRAIGCLIALGVMSACVAPAPFEPRPPADQRGGSNEATPGQPSIEATEPSPRSQPEPAPRARTLSAASRALVDQAHAQLAAGNDALAAATLERALRIEPDHPQLWLELAKVRQEEGNAAQAENLARKALSMAVGDSATQAAAWRVIAQSYRARGRNPEAREADARAAALAGRG